ncbi:unnamed protein product [Cylicocyclus nassatus]|uniref:Innexin n=1 Tax=Cylicocyclus nassatus TaxID=53992 RepID=A0AA36GIC1_CYLNA|nr:unnamed protein product [Cylicocyclus nassatus]
MLQIYIGSPIVCWTPAEFRGGWIEYTRDYCLIENTYYVPLNDPELPHVPYREQKELPYYQWVQFVLVLLAFCFYLPHIYWRSVNWWSGIQLRAIVRESCELPQDDVSKREQAIDKIAGHIYRTTHRKYKDEGSAFHNMVRTGWMSSNYLFMKFLFVLNIVFQILILHMFLGFHWGDLFQLKLGFNTDWKATGLFPRSTMCDFEVRTKGNLQRYSVQCVLSLNMFNEKIFLVLFYWLIILFFLTLVNFCLWVKKLLSREDQLAFVRRMLESAGIQRRKIHVKLEFLVYESLLLAKQASKKNTIHAWKTTLANLYEGRLKRVSTISENHSCNHLRGCIAALDKFENLQISGMCNHCYSHAKFTYRARIYVCQVKLRGIPDPETGMVYDLAELKQDMKTILDTVDHKNLDKDVEFFQHNVSTSENVAIYLWEKLRVQMKKPKLLYKVTIITYDKSLMLLPH